MNVNPLHLQTRKNAAPERGFTLLETMLAAVMGSMFVLITVGLLYAMQRSDIAMAQRAAESSDLHRARLVMSRCFSTLLTSEQPPPPKPGQEGAAARSRSPRAKPVDGKAAEGDAAEPEPERVPPPPRVVLASRTSGAGSTVQLTSGEVREAPMQRMELVVFESPVPSVMREDGRARAVKSNRPKRESESTAAPGEGGALDTPPEEEDPLEEAEPDEIPLKAIRGALELRPTAIDEINPDDSRPPGYELWWVPLPRRAPADAEIDEALQAELASIDRPFKVASNIAHLQWRMFDDRKKKSEFEATWDFQLPAYIECQIEMRSGMRAEWMFEVGWGVGPEVRLPKPEVNGENRAEPVEDGVNRPGSKGSPSAPSRGGNPGGGNAGGGNPGGSSGGGTPKGQPK